GETHSFGDVVDQGDEWIFHATSGPNEGDEFSVRKADLERGRWDVAIPVHVQARLEAEGAVARPRREPSLRPAHAPRRTSFVPRGSATAQASSPSLPRRAARARRRDPRRARGAPWA